MVQASQTGGGTEADLGDSANVEIDDFSEFGGLEPGEEVVWTGRGSGYNLSFGPFKYIAISLFVGSIWGWTFLANGSSGGHVLLGIFGVVVALLSALPQLLKVIRPRHERYILTNRRVLISHPGKVLVSHFSYYPVRALEDWRMNGGIKAVKVSKARRSVIFEGLILATDSPSNQIEAAFVGIDDPEFIGKLAAETLDLPLKGAAK